MNARTRFTVAFSASPFPYETVLSFVAPKLGRWFGGARCRPIDGVWSADGHSDADLFQPGRVEAGMEIVITVLRDTENDLAFLRIKELLDELEGALELGLSWVHVEVESSSARHFQVGVDPSVESLSDPDR